MTKETPQHYTKRVQLPKLFSNLKFGIWPGITRKQKVTLGFTIFLLFVLPISIFLALGPVNLLPRASGPSISPTPAVSPTPTPSGPFSLYLQNPQTAITCVLGDQNCYYSSVVMITNKTDKPLYSSTIYLSAPDNNMTYVNFDGVTTTAQSTTAKVIGPGESLINTWVKVTAPNRLGISTATFYVDAKTCNTAVTPPDCYFYGASSFRVTIEVVPKNVATASPTPTPILLPTLKPSPTPTPVPINGNPVLQTASLPDGQWLSDYKASIIGYDYNVSDTLSMEITGLPFGLKQAPCNTWKTADKSQISCVIYGRPYTSGIYKVGVTLKDNKGGVTNGLLNLVIRFLSRPSTE